MKYLVIGGLFLLLSGIPFLTKGQLYIDQQTQHRFAQTYIGLNTQIVPTSGQLFWDNQSYHFPSMSIPRLTIGGLHFWGRLDFKINFSLAHLGDFNIDEETDLIFRPGGDFSARYYPWRIKNGKIRPFVGISMNQMTLALNNRTSSSRADLLINISPVGGLSYSFKDWQLNTEIRWSPKHEVDFYTNQIESSRFRLPSTYYSLGITKYFDTTLKEEKNLLNGETRQIEDKLRSENRLNTFSVGIAPSVAYFLQAPKYQQAERQSIPQHKAKINWEFGLGYLFHGAGWHLGLSYRDYTSSRASYGLDHLYRRSSTALEAYKFLLDYNGFAPFLGISLSSEKWAAAEFENNTRIGEVQRTKMISPGIIFGWDILPSPVETWLLRTNLRYYPFQRVNDIAGNKSRVDQFEFNFIQLVIYPNRLINIPRARRK